MHLCELIPVAYQCSDALLTCRYASAFHYLSASINLKSDFPSSYMYLAVTLSRLEDLENACSAYDKAIEMER